jgi:N-acetylmuramoyl-L-alanine amidase
MTKIFLAVFLIFSAFTAFSQTWVNANPKKGDGIYALLRRYHLPTTPDYVNKFKEINEDLLGADNELNLEIYYHMPVLIYDFDGVTIRSTLGISDYQHAKSIQNYNEKVQRSGLRDEHYTKDKKLWVPYFDVSSPDDPVVEPAEDPSNPLSSTPVAGDKHFSIFGAAYADVPQVDNSLSGYYFYLVSGHGGPDPGAYGQYGGHNLYEDEYAYDITLRMAHKLIQHGATVYIIVRDRNDGIRDTAVLRGDHDEYYYGGARISRRTKTRLAKRAEIINGLYRQNKTKAKGQYTIVVHVDSRSNSQRIDLFYYYKKNHSAGRRFAQTLHQRVKKEYAEHQPGRGYDGTVTWRDLYMLRNVLPTTVYIEVANIRNQRDQDRLVLVNNRQAVANWLVRGMQDYLR